MDVLLDEKDEEFLAEWDAADAEALAAIQALLGRVPDRARPQADLRRAAGRLRRDLARAGWPGRLLIECSGLRPKSLPADDTELWLSLAAGVASPQGPDDWDRPGSADGDPDDIDDTDSEIAAICAIDHFDWLAVITALAEGGPGTPASAADLARYVRDYDPEELDRPDDEPPAPADGETPDDEDLDDAYFDDDDDLTLEGLFLPVTSLWQVLGAIDDEERLTSLGWWGLPEAMLRVWAPSTGPVG
jgi:hypothetical protein